MRTKWNMVIDLALCNDCNCCLMADKDEFTGNDWPPFSKAQPWEGQRWIDIERKERGQFPQIQMVHRPSPCMHCDNAPCMEAAPDGAIYKRQDGLVIIDPEKAAGHPEMVDSCPYGAIFWNDEANIAQKCTGCAHLMEEGWTQTRCTQGCPTGALKLILADEDQMKTMVESEDLAIYRPELATKPRVYYKNLHKWTTAFIAGSVVFGDTGECAEGAEILVARGDETVSRVHTNNFGDYCVDRLIPGAYTVTVRAAGYEPVKSAVTLEPGSLTLPALFLKRVG